VMATMAVLAAVYLGIGISWIGLCELTEEISARRYHKNALGPATIAELDVEFQRLLAKRAEATQ
jgi:hypothetical protein